MIEIPLKSIKQRDFKPKVLLVEDEQPLRDAFSFLLMSEKYPHETASDGIAALKKLRSFKPDIILLDLLMPMMDGIEFLHKANLKLNHPNCKVIIMSNLADVIRVRDVAHFNVKKVLIKANLSPREIVHVIQKYA